MTCPSCDEPLPRGPYCRCRQCDRNAHVACVFGHWCTTCLYAAPYERAKAVALAEAWTEDLGLEPPEYASTLAVAASLMVGANPEAVRALVPCEGLEDAMANLVANFVWVDGGVSLDTETPEVTQISVCLAILCGAGLVTKTRTEAPSDKPLPRILA